MQVYPIRRLPTSTQIRAFGAWGAVAAIGAFYMIQVSFQNEYRSMKCISALGLDAIFHSVTGGDNVAVFKKKHGIWDFSFKQRL